MRNRITLETARLRVTIEFDELDPKVRDTVEYLSALLDLGDDAEGEGEGEGGEEYDPEGDDGAADEARAAAGDREFLRTGAR